MKSLSICQDWVNLEVSPHLGLWFHLSNSLYFLCSMRHSHFRYKVLVFNFWEVWRSNWPNYHRLLRESLQPFDEGSNRKKLWRKFSSVFCKLFSKMNFVKESEISREKKMSCKTIVLQLQQLIPQNFSRNFRIFVTQKFCIFFSKQISGISLLMFS